MQLSIWKDFKSEIHSKLKEDFEKEYNNSCWFFIKNYSDVLIIDNLKGKINDAKIEFSEIYFDVDSDNFDFDTPLEITNKNYKKPNFPKIPFIAKSIVYDVVGKKEFPLILSVEGSPNLRYQKIISNKIIFL